MSGWCFSHPPSLICQIKATARKTMLNTILFSCHNSILICSHFYGSFYHYWCRQTATGSSQTNHVRHNEIFNTHVHLQDKRITEHLKPESFPRYAKLCHWSQMAFSSLICPFDTQRHKDYSTTEKFTTTTIPQQRLGICKITKNTIQTSERGQERKIPRRGGPSMRNILRGYNPPWAQGTLTCVSEHVPLQGICPWKDSRTVRTGNILQAVWVSVPLPSQQLIFASFLLILTCSISAAFFLETVSGLQKRAKFISVCGSQHLLYAGKLPTWLQIHTTAKFRLIFCSFLSTSFLSQPSIGNGRLLWITRLSQVTGQAGVSLNGGHDCHFCFGVPWFVTPSGAVHCFGTGVCSLRFQQSGSRRHRWNDLCNGSQWWQLFSYWRLWQERWRWWFRPQGSQQGRIAKKSWGNDWDSQMQWTFQWLGMSDSPVFLRVPTGTKNQRTLQTVVGFITVPRSSQVLIPGFTWDIIFILLQGFGDGQVDRLHGTVIEGQGRRAKQVLLLHLHSTQAFVLLREIQWLVKIHREVACRFKFDGNVRRRPKQEAVLWLQERRHGLAVHISAVLQ